ncbi:copper transporter 1-like [Salvia hispanica]|uniref:copper transporter 1-like n=1 Tax=Salvia hispanica TaxID=49212 RepID=UPI0020096FD3|nr:copper transporter 1-like [Salvia hispanica]
MDHGMPMMHRRHMMMHMTFFWGKDTEILFDSWPGSGHLAMYLLALAVIFFLAVAVEWFSHSERRPAAALLQTLMYALRIGLAYLVMLAIMSFNGAVFVAAVAGHAVGFFFFGSRAFSKGAAQDSGNGKASDLPPMSC